MNGVALRACVTLAFGLALGCTFGGLADYDTPECDPTLPRSKDPCAALDVGAGSCPLHHCSARTHHCTADREAESCDGVDDDCNGIADEDLLGPRVAATTPGGTLPADAAEVSLSAATASGDVYAAFTSGGCAKGLLAPMRGSAATLDFACAPGVTLRQPAIAPLLTPSRSTLGLVAIDVGETLPGATRPCTDGVVSFRGSTNAHVNVSGCGAALPALASFAGGDQAVIAWVDSPLADRSDPVAACSSVRGAPLRVRWLERAASDAAQPTITATPTSSSSTLAPPALLALPDADYVLLAAPSEGGVRVWALGKEVQSRPLLVPIFADPISGTGDAHAASLAVGGRAGSPRLAVAMTQGCAAAQRVSLFIATFDRKTTQASPLGTFEVAGSGEGGLAPTVAWVDSRAEWWVSWRGGSDGKTVRLRRFSADGQAAGAAVDLGPGLGAIARGDEAARFGSSVLVATTSSLSESGAACP